MKPVVADYKTRVICLRIVPTSGTVVRLTDYPSDLAMSNSEIYRTEHGYDFTGYDSTATFASSSVDLSGILSSGAISRADLDSGVYDNARVYLFATSWGAPIEDEEPLAMLFFGAVSTTDDRYTVQLMGAIDVLSQSVGKTYSASCQNVLFDQTVDGTMLPVSQSRCTGPRSAPDGPVMADYIVSGTLTSVTDQYSFSDSARAEVDDYFAYGSIRFTSGLNAGLKPKEIKIYTLGGAITLHEALAYLPAVGDAYEMIPGCRKRMTEDCFGKFGNGKNFGGQPNVPVPSVAGEVGRGV